MTEDKGQYQFGTVKLFRTSTKPVVLCYEGYGPVDHERFARLFREVWQTLDRGDRYRILRHWRRQEQEAIPWLPYRNIMLTNTAYSNFYSNSETNPACAQVSWGGHSMTFYAPVMEALPDCHTKCVIAHELAHILQWSHGMGWNLDDDWERESMELEADEVAQCWGHDIDAYIQYCRDHRDELPDLPQWDE